MQLAARTFLRAGRDAGDIVMDEFDIPRLAVWMAAVIISLGIWAVIIGGLTLL